MVIRNSVVKINFCVVIWYHAILRFAKCEMGNIIKI